MENFWKAVESINWATPKAIEFRVYYNENGSIQCYTNEELPGNYILVDKEIWHSNRFDVKVVNGKLEELKVVPTKLVPVANGGYTCALNDVTIIVSASTPHTKWNLKTHEQY